MLSRLHSMSRLTDFLRDRASEAVVQLIPIWGTAAMPSGTRNGIRRLFGCAADGAEPLQPDRLLGAMRHCCAFL